MLPSVLSSFAPWPKPLLDWNPFIKNMSKNDNKSDLLCHVSCLCVSWGFLPLKIKLNAVIDLCFFPCLYICIFVVICFTLCVVFFHTLAKTTSYLKSFEKYQNMIEKEKCADLLCCRKPHRSTETVPFWGFFAHPCMLCHCPHSTCIKYFVLDDK